MGSGSGAATSVALGRPVLEFEQIDRGRIGLVGGKGAHLGELSRIEGVDVPPGFCVTTEAFRRVTAGAPAFEERLDRLSRLDPDDRDAIAASSAEIREVVATLPVPDDLATAVTGPLRDGTAYAVRSSATAEDLPTASFAGQQDTYLNVVGAAAVLDHVRRCWASLFTERAVVYRLRGGVEHRQVRMAVVVQEMVVPDASGVLFTADPVTSNRRVTSVEAVLGLGEALVSGQVNADRFTVRDGAVVDRAIASKQWAVRASAGGGTRPREVAPQARHEPALTDEQVLRLAELGRRIEAHFGCPQDIEWCLAGDDVRIVQSRPITTLFPVPPTADGGAHVYLSVGHQQMMTDPLKPLGLSFWQMTTPRPMAEAGGRLFVDATPMLASAAGRQNLLEAMGRSDPLMADALRTVVDRGDLVGEPTADAGMRAVPPTEPVDPDPAVVEELIARTRASLAVLDREIRTRQGPDLLDFVREDLQELRRLLFDPVSHRVFMTAMNAAWWLEEHLREWLGEEGAADTLTQSVPNSITSEMGLALLDVADVVRSHPEVVEFLRGVSDDHFLDDLPRVAGGREARDAIRGYLDTYGMRCAGEIDITRPRWSEQPSVLVPVLLGHVEHAEPGASRRRFEQGRQEAWDKEQDLLARLRALPDGERRATETKTMIDRLRTFIGYREYPKFGMVSRYLRYKQALLREADRLVRDGVVADREDVFFLRFEELEEAVRTGCADGELIMRRKAEYRGYQALTPPRVITSDGEALSGAYRRDDLPPGALAGLAVSAGTVEGRARVVLDMAQADLDTDDILVTAYTDPSWSPVFVTIKALVTEVGGQMTHGAVVAREYGLPAVVGVERATRLIRDGQRIRVNGTSGYVEILS
ncbi:phosphoenolpyruvate synthase [Pseudonocardia kujensis]|uniref:rifamycin-inactivating phosphotransferase n=1 Tax=Pseudonocardia kujensis TaxID=1128675 RepID=UPI001E4FEC2C|nr:rifamycin-inactivating phosphotransferase [Pseudonocardia kujensis]MCE0765407.1 phosphoenolpyruvate synthase [Pseudonocardia kujensis]